MKKLISLLILIVSTAFIASCAGGISSSVREQVDQNITFATLQTAPQNHEGTYVMFAGTIIAVHSRSDHTLLELLQRPADRRGHPLQREESAGRFFARTTLLLDPALYGQGRLVTVAGRVSGAVEGTVGDYPYTFPLMDIEEIHLWPREEDIHVYHHYPYPGPWYGPYGPWWRY